MKKLLAILVLGLGLTLNAEAQETKKLPDISVYDQAIQESLEGKCGYSKRHEGPAAYIKCLNNQISGLNQLNSMPDISKLENWIQESLEGKCGYSKRHEGPAAYIRCLNGELASLNIKAPSIIIVKNESNETLKKTTNKEEKKKIVKEEKDIKSLTQKEAIEKYLSGRELDPIEGIWILKNRVSVFYKEGDKIICRIIRSTQFKSGEQYCTLTKGSKKIYYGEELRGKPEDRTINQTTVKLYGANKAEEKRKIWNALTFEIAGGSWSSNHNYDRLWPETTKPSSGSGAASSGSAFFVTAKGHLVTNYHVVEGCNDQSKIMYKDKEYSAKLLASDKKLDLALLKTDLKNKGYLNFSYDPKKMQKIYAAGYPLGKFLSDDLKFTDGIISSLKGFEDNTNQIQISAAINLGNSGGPVINQSGELVGVVVSGMDKGLTEGINFAIKSGAVKTFLTANKIKPSSSFYSRELKNDKLLMILEEATIYIFCH